MKKFLLLIVMILLVTVGCVGCSKTETTYNGIKMGKLEGWPVEIMGVRYNLYSNGYAEIVNILNPYCELANTIIYEGKEYEVVKIIEPVSGVSDSSIFQNTNGKVGYVEAPDVLDLPDGISSFNTLGGCSSKTIILPENLQSVGKFWYCTNIETIEFPESIERCNTYQMFAGCSSLKEITLSNDWTYVGSTASMFSGCSSLKTITLPGSIKNISDYTFSDCEMLSEITLEDGITTVQGRAFNNLPALEVIVFPNSITELNNNVFYDCPNLKEIYLSDNLSDVPTNLFKQSYGNYDADSSGITIHVKESMIDYVQNLYPDAKVVAK